MPCRRRCNSPKRSEPSSADVDVVIDLVGDQHDSTSIRSLDVLGSGGLIVAIPSGVSPGLAAAADAKGMRATAFLVEPDGPTLTRIAQLIDSGEVVVEVDEVFPLDQAVAAHTRGESKHTRGKLALRVAS
ncbi:zinc-binding dehydrogenase [Amycolatopsis sp. NPDC049868]|uniref:zinc-binding dehydrogenase n=1 Tax=Amycolatopsis sp. NPDC049868 TaxID=3363934 RepID=UPI00378CD5E1